MRALAIALLVGALAIRIFASGAARFTGDEAELWSIGRSIATFEHAPAFGPAITGSPARLPGPLCFYLAAVPQVFGASPRLGSIFVALLHLLAGLMMAQLAVEARGKRAGLIFLALFAFAPWDILYGDRIWPSCLMPAFGTFTLYAAVKSRDSVRWQGALIFLLAVLPQLHLSAPMCWVACAAILILRPPVRWSRTALGIGALAAFLTYLPGIISELATNFQNTRAIFTYSGGKEGISYSALSVVKTMIYAVVFGSADIEFHLNRGYWTGNFDDMKVYITGAAWYWGRFPQWLSIFLALGGWIAAVVSAIPKVRKRELDSALVVAIVLSYAVGGILLAMSRKLFFPHYVGLLVPAALLPIVFGLEGLRNIWLVPSLALSAITMAYQTINYYRTIDSLNGVAVTQAMVGAAVEEKGTLALSFDGYPNDYAWHQLARVYYKKDLQIDQRGDVRWRVHNGEHFTGEELPKNALLFDGVLVERTSNRPPNLVARASENLAAMRIDAVHPDGSTRSCGPAPCRYGDQPWQEIRPETFEVRGRKESLLFMHPVQRGTVTAHVPVPAGAHKGALRFALSDTATRASNTAPVEVTLAIDGKNVAKGNATNDPGLKALPFVLSSTAAEVSIAISTEQDGARVFGFDIDFFH